MTDLAVIMSVYQNDKLEYVEKSVQSILTQTYSDFDYFIAIDGPVSLEIENYLFSLTDSRIKLFKIAENVGLACALNFLLEIILKNADYIFIARMDSDDISMPDRFKKQHEYLIVNLNISVLGSWVIEINESGEPLNYRKFPFDHEALRRRYYIRTPFFHSSVIFTRELIETVGFYPADTILMEDNALWGKALGAGLNFANIPEFLLKFRLSRNFYLRRSGINYGWNYIKTRFKITKTSNLPRYTYILSLLIGITKAMPPFILRYFYSVNNIYSQYYSSKN